MIVAKSTKRIIGNLLPYVNYAQRLADKKLENIYIIGSAADENIRFIDQISQKIIEKITFEKYLTKRYTAKIKIQGERVEVDNYLVLLRSFDSQRYYDEEFQEKFFVESV